MSAGDIARSHDLGARTTRAVRALADRIHLSYVIVAAAFAVSRIAYRALLDMQFDMSPFRYFLQYAPSWFFANDFWRSILYLHHQAPLQNLLVGGVWRIFGEPTCFAVLEAIYLVLGFTFAMALLATMRRLGVHVVIATIATITYVVSPVVVEYEMWLFYHTPVITFLMLGAWGLLRFYEVGTVRAGAFAFSMLAIAALFRNIYGPFWLLVTAGLLLLRPPPPRRPRASPRLAVLLAAAIPIAVVAANGMKAKLLLGVSSADTLAAENLVFKTWAFVPPLERERLKEEKLVSGAVDHEPFASLESMPELRTPHPPTGVPLLDMTMTPTGERNHHALEIVLIGDRYYAKDAAFLLRNYPGAYFESVKAALQDWYFSSPTRDMIFHQTPNYKRAQVIERRLAKLGGTNKDGRVKLLVIVLPFAFLYGVYRALRPRSLLESERSKTAALLFMTMTIAYVTFGTTMISFGDFSRYRFDVDPFSFVFVAMFVQHAAAGALALGRSGVAQLAALARTRAAASNARSRAHHGYP